MDDDFGAVQIGSQSIAGGAENPDGFTGQAAGNITLAQAVFNQHLLVRR
ncbi:hypothetical protein SDC9_189756 [bioreactor metagenome]|uniref:Uncharacterized protein n=1 Tax=bioreactor metagenome TaxID=1076179 RepID=A0A645HTL8_9ZZZZ